MGKINALTPDQERQLSEWHARWLAIGTSTDRADRPRAEAAILAMRCRIGVTRAPTFVWCDSPATMALAVHVIQSGASLGASLGDSLSDSLGASLSDSLRASLGASLRASLSDSLGDSLSDSLSDSLGASLRASLGASLWASLGASLGASLRDTISESWWGQCESYWIAHYLFARDVLGVRFDPQKSSDLDLWAELAQSCGWWLCYENYVFISERPTVCRLDDRRVMHAGHGPALAFADGWAVYSWHGTRIPAEWIEDRASLTPAVALGVENMEQRRAACEILGWDRILVDLGAVTIHADPDSTIGELVEVTLPDAGRERFLRVTCGTGRKFAIPVPPDVQTAIEANAWTYGLDVSEFKPEFRT